MLIHCRLLFFLNRYIPTDLLFDELPSKEGEKGSENENALPMSMVMQDPKRQKRIALLTKHCIHAVLTEEKEKRNSIMLQQEEKEEKNNLHNATTIENVLVQAGDTSPGRKTKSIPNKFLEKSSNILRRAYRLADILSLKRSFVNTIVKEERKKMKKKTNQLLKEKRKKEQKTNSDEESEEESSEEESSDEDNDENLNEVNSLASKSNICNTFLTCKKEDMNAMLLLWKKNNLHFKILQLSVLEEENKKEENNYFNYFVENGHVVTVRSAKKIAINVLEEGDGDEEEKEINFQYGIDSLVHRECLQLALVSLVVF